LRGQKEFQKGKRRGEERRVAKCRWYFTVLLIMWDFTEDRKISFLGWEFVDFFEQILDCHALPTRNTRFSNLGQTVHTWKPCHI
jgi:hypothetical protein